ncbi:MAG: hypothetical protein N4A71_05510 [Carboxylicivirga sp.]|jgi:hypothetical protein|nr:hypothetical protein [Carboxylicivirga sp.]
MTNYEATYVVDLQHNKRITFSCDAKDGDRVVESAYYEILKRTGVGSNRITDLVVNQLNTF